MMCQRDVTCVRLAAWLRFPAWETRVSFPQLGRAALQGRMAEGSRGVAGWAGSSSPSSEKLV